MHRIVFFVLLMLAPALSGCAAPDLIFGALENFYSGGGTTSVERRYHRDQQLEAWDSYNRYGSTP